MAVAVALPETRHRQPEERCAQRHRIWNSTLGITPLDSGLRRKDDYRGLWPSKCDCPASGRPKLVEKVIDRNDAPWPDMTSDKNAFKYEDTQLQAYYDPFH